MAGNVRAAYAVDWPLVHSSADLAAHTGRPASRVSPAPVHALFRDEVEVCRVSPWEGHLSVT